MRLCSLLTSIGLISCILFDSFCSAYPQHEAPYANHFIDPCAQIKCQTDEICVPNNALDANCLPRDQLNVFDNNFHFIKKRQIIQKEKLEVHESGRPRIMRPKVLETNEIVSPCLGHKCRYGECEIVDPSHHTCHCVPGVTGENCNLLSNMTNPCSVNPCFGQSACINLSNNKFVCICRSGRSGPTCKGHIAPCQCTSHGKCRLIELDVFACDCDEGYGGHLCQYRLIEREKYEENITPLPIMRPTRICTPETCLNGGTCLQINPSVALCLCSYNYRGPFCDRIHLNTTIAIASSDIKTTTLATVPVENECPGPLKNVCLNGGVCRSRNFSSTFSCECKPGYRGTFCNLKEPFCFQTDRCQNGGTCYQTDLLNGKCACHSSFKGLYCEIGLECNPNPCRNNQPCLLINGKPKCICIQGFNGPNCD